MTILDALSDSNLFGAAFPEPETWAAWGGPSWRGV
jgi:hypothetical protein